MKTYPTSDGKMLPQRPNEAGESRIEQRARELAEIRGAGHRFTKEDLAQAERELRGQELPLSSPQDENATGGAARDLSEPVVDRGHQVEDMPTNDQNMDSARLAEEGVDEAQHDLMLAARRRRQT